MIKKLYNFFKRWDYRIKFLMVGALNTIVGVGCYWLLLWAFGVNIFQQNAGSPWQVILATLISQIIGLIHSYLWNKFFTFESKKKSKAETIKFISVYLVVFCLDYILKLTLNLIPKINQFIIAIITTIVTMIISFVGQKYFVFKYKKSKNNNENNLEELNNISEDNKIENNQ